MYKILKRLIKIIIIIILLFIILMFAIFSFSNNSTLGINNLSLSTGSECEEDPQCMKNNFKQVLACTNNRVSKFEGVINVEVDGDNSALVKNTVKEFMTKYDIKFQFVDSQLEDDNKKARENTIIFYVSNSTKDLIYNNKVVDFSNLEQQYIDKFTANMKEKRIFNNNFFSKEGNGFQRSHTLNLALDSKHLKTDTTNLLYSSLGLECLTPFIKGYLNDTSKDFISILTRKDRTNNMLRTMINTITLNYYKEEIKSGDDIEQVMSKVYNK